MFRDAGPEAWWFTCPVCVNPILSPPEADTKVAAAMCSLQLAEVKEVLDTPPTPHNAFDMYFYML